MTDQLTREQFKAARSDAITGVLNVYREVDVMFRELAAALAGSDPRMTALVKKLVPPAGSKNPDARYLRNYHAWIFAPAGEIDEDDDDEDDEEGEEEEVEGKKPKRTLSIMSGTSLVVVRATVFDRSVMNFEPNFVVGTLTNCRTETALLADAEIKIGRGRFRRVLRAIDNHRGGTKPIHTEVPVTIGSQKNKQKLVCDMPGGWKRHALFDITPAAIQEIAASIRAGLVAKP